jgi:hypothetical protein
VSDQLTLGDALKDTGMALADSAAAPDWKARWDEAILELARGGLPFTSDEVRELAGPPTDHPNAAGSRFAAAARAGVIERIGYRNSTRAVLHSHPLSVWRGRS